MRRIAIIGSGGSGKSSLACRLGEALGIEVVHLDLLYWSGDWVRRPAGEWRELQQSLVAAEAWVIDGNYGGTMGVRLEAADTVVFLDLPTLTCLRRVVARRFRPARRRVGIAMRHRLTLEFVRWVWRYRRDRRPGILARLEALRPDQRAVILTGTAEVERFVAYAAASAARGAATRSTRTEWPRRQRKVPWSRSRSSRPANVEPE